MNDLKMCRMGDECESKRMGVYPTAPLMPDTRDYFYSLPHANRSRNECIECFKKQSRNPKFTNNQVGAMARTAFIGMLNKQGIPAKAKGRSVVEAGGIAQIKVLGSLPNKDNSGWQLSFVPSKQSGMVMDDLFAFCLYDNELKIIHTAIFPIAHKAFFSQDTGLLKFGISILIEPRHRKGNNCPLTMDDIRNHENNWRLVRVTIDNLCTYLKDGNLEQYRLNRAKFVPV